MSTEKETTGESNQDELAPLAEAIREKVKQLEKQGRSKRIRHSKTAKKAQRNQ